MKQMGIPQVIYLSLLALGLGYDLADHGKPRTGTKSFWASLVAVIIQVAILTWVGFF